MPSRPESVHVFINPAAGQDKPVLAILARTFHAAGIRWTATILQPDDDLASLALERARAADAPDWIAVSGGDGTVSVAAGALAGSERPLAILPGGTGNVIAQELGLPLDYEAAARALFLGATEGRALDLVDAAGTTCILRAGLGGDARLMASADREAKDSLGWLAYLKAAIDEVTTENLSRLGVEVDGHAFETDVLTALVLNTSRLGRGGAVLSSNVRPDDGLLDLMLVRRGSLAAIAQVLRSVIDEHGELPRSTLGAPGDETLVVEHLQAREIALTPLDRMEFQVDGDVRPDLVSNCRVDFRVRDERVVLVAPVPSV